MKLMYIVVFYTLSIITSGIPMKIEPIKPLLNGPILSLRNDIAIKRVSNNNLFSCKYTNQEKHFYSHFNQTLNANVRVIKSQVYRDIYIDDKNIVLPLQYQCNIVISSNENTIFKVYLDSFNISDNLMERLNNNSQEIIKPNCCFWNKEIVACASHEERLIFLLNNNVLIEGIISKSDVEDHFLLSVNHVDQIINETHQFNDKNCQLHYNETIKKFELIYVADKDLHQVEDNDSDQSINSHTNLEELGNTIPESNNNPLGKSNKKRLFFRPFVARLVIFSLFLGIAMVMMRYFQT